MEVPHLVDGLHELGTDARPDDGAYAEVVSFGGTMVALHWLTAGAVAEDRDE